MFVDQDVVKRVEMSLAGEAAATAASLAALNPRLGSAATAVAGGQVVLLGPGFYVNRGIALGLSGEVTNEDFDVLERVSERMGVAAEVEICPWAHRSLLDRAVGRGLRPIWFRTTLIQSLTDDGYTVTTDDQVVVEEAHDAASLREWQDVTATGFGYIAPKERRISDLYATAQHNVIGASFYTAYVGGKAVGAATLVIRDRTAILGGMSTVPQARRHGVQRALIRSRLAAAAASKCDLAVATTASGSGSERNVVRSGFAVAYTKLALRRSLATAC